MCAVLDWQDARASPDDRVASDERHILASKGYEGHDERSYPHIKAEASGSIQAGRPLKVISSETE